MSGGCVGVVKIWDTSSGDLVQSLEGPGEAINWIEWHPKGDVVLAGSEDYSVWMWGARVGKCMQVNTLNQMAAIRISMRFR
jgi:ribosome assembly protein SQT1